MQAFLRTERRRRSCLVAAKTSAVSVKCVCRQAGIHQLLATSFKVRKVYLHNNGLYCEHSLTAELSVSLAKQEAWQCYTVVKTIICASMPDMC